MDSLSIEGKGPWTYVFKNGFWRGKGNSIPRGCPHGAIFASEAQLEPIDDEMRQMDLLAFALNDRLNLEGVWTFVMQHFGCTFGWFDAMPADMSEEDAEWIKQKAGWCKLTKKEIIGMLYWYRTDIKEAG